MLTIRLPAAIDVALLPERALYWPAGETLFVADLHVGKPDVFHKAGIPVPAAVTADDLARLSAALEKTGARRLVVLGDFFHAAGSRSPGVFAALAAWRARHPALAVDLVTGNHDRHAGAPPAELEFTPCGDALSLGPFVCVHEPQDDPAPYTLCGHLHPVALLSEPRGLASKQGSLRLPCFHVGARQMVLPAFGRFTGGKAVTPRPGDRIFVLAGDQVLEAPVR